MRKIGFEKGVNVNGKKLWKWEKKQTAAAKLLQSCPALCDPTDGSPPGSPIPGILQARTLEWVAMKLKDACGRKAMTNLYSILKSRYIIY